MYGSGSLCLLTISILILAPVMLHGQADRPKSAPDFALPAAARRSPSRRSPTNDRSFSCPAPLAASAAGNDWLPPDRPRRRHNFFRHCNCRRAPSRCPWSIAGDCRYHIPYREGDSRRRSGRKLNHLAMDWPVVGRPALSCRRARASFLYPPSKLGLTSSVGGEMGRFTLDPWGRIVLSAEHFSAFRADPVLGGKSRASLSDFALAVRRASQEE
jgi:hypothetical protein